jgi:hypothetical protein
MVLWWVLVHCVRSEWWALFQCWRKDKRTKDKKEKDTQKKLKITQTKQKEELDFLTKDYGKMPTMPKRN